MTALVMEKPGEGVRVGTSFKHCSIPVVEIRAPYQLCFPFRPFGFPTGPQPSNHKAPIPLLCHLGKRNLFLPVVPAKVSGQTSIGRARGT